jgi:hypothetical protein
LCYLLKKVRGEPMRSDSRVWHGGRVLVCDDNLLIADVVAEFLRECGLEPTGPVGRLESPMRMARERALDGAILDINLNGRPCFPICAILAARRIPFIPHWLPACGNSHRIRVGSPDHQALRAE